MIETKTEGPIVTLTLNRPDKANALTHAMLSNLKAAAEQAIARDETRVILLTGTGTVFSAGADLDAARAGLATDPVWEDLSTTIANAPCLTIAALNGTVAGGATGMVLAADLRIAAPSAKFFYPVMKLGFLPQPSDPVRMAALIGPARTKLILMGGAKLTAAEALTYGLIDQISDTPLQASKNLASDAASAKNSHVAAIKGMIP